MTSLSVIIPGYNEEANIEATVMRCMADLELLVDVFEIVLVDDGSTDGTGALADALHARFPQQVQVVHNPVNCGVGISLLIGMQRARHELVVHNAMDYPFHLCDLTRVLPLFPEHDVVILVRTDRSAHSPWRKITSLVNYWLIRLLFNVPFRDMNFVQVYKRSALPRIKPRGRSPAFVTPEMLIRALDAGCRLGQVKAEFRRRERGQASYGKPRDILWTLGDMIGFWQERRLRRKDIDAVGRTGEGTGERWSGPDWQREVSSVDTERK